MILLDCCIFQVRGDTVLSLRNQGSRLVCGASSMVPMNDDLNNVIEGM